MNVSDWQKPSPEKINYALDTLSNTHLHLLCQRKAPLAQIREAVTELGADLHALNNNKMPPLGLAIMEGEAATVSALIDMGSPLYFSVGKGIYFNAAVLAVLSGRLDVLNIVLDQGGAYHVNLHGINSRGNEEKLLCLHLAATELKLAMIPPLVKAGAFIDEEAGDRGLSPLQLASTQNLGNALKPLIENGADVEYANTANGFTALHYAVLQQKDFSIVTLVQCCGADVNAVSKDGFTPLMLAVIDGNGNMIDFLLRNKADPNIKRTQDDGETALILAAKKGNFHVVHALIQAKADPLLTDAFNHTAAQVARSYNHTSAALILEETEKEAQYRKFDKIYSSYKP